MKKSVLSILSIIVLLSITLTPLVSGCSNDEQTNEPSTSSSETTATTSVSEPVSEPESEPEQEAEEVYELSFSSQWAETSPTWQEEFKLIIEEMEAESNGRLKITLFLAGALGKNEEQYDIVRTGKADMTNISTGYTPGRFPLFEIMTLPLAYESTYAHEEMVNAVGERIIYQDFPDTHICNYDQSEMFYLYTNKPVTTIEDVKGMKIRTSGNLVTKTVETLGGAPVSMGLGDLYLSLQTGVVDAVIAGCSGIMSFKLNEVVQNEVLINLGCSSRVWAVNQKTWDSLPEDLQQIITTASQKSGQYEVDLVESNHANMLTLLTGTSTKLSDEEYARWVEALSPVVNEYLDELRAKDLPADELMDIIREECANRDLSFPY